MKHPAVCHWDVNGASGKKTREFYTKLFDWELQNMGDADYGLIGPGGEGTIGGGVGGVSPGDAPGVVVYVQVDDIQKYLERAEKLGGKTKLPPTPIPGHGHFALFTDPDGITMGLFKGNE